MARILDHISDEDLRLYTGLTDAQLKRGEYLDATLANGVFVAESQRVIERALDAGLQPLSLFMEQKWLDHERAIIDRLSQGNPDIPIYVITHDQFRDVTGYQITRGALAAFARPALPSVADVLDGAAHVAVLEGITNYANLGAIFRSAAALGIDAVLVSPTCHDPLYRRCARVSMGAVFQVPWTRIGKVNDWAPDGVAQLHDAGFTVAAMALRDEAVALDGPQLAACDKLAIVLGTEGDGLAASTIDACDYTVRIPMDHGVDSLNVAAASAIAFWEMRRRQSL